MKLGVIPGLLIILLFKSPDAWNQNPFANILLEFYGWGPRTNVNWISSLSDSDRLEIQLTFGSRCWWLNERHFLCKRPIKPTDPQYIVGSSSSQPSGTKSGTKSIPNNELRFGASANMRNQVEPNQEPNQFPIVSWDFAFLPTCGTKWNQGRNQVNSQ